jgi:hypothetical protein
MKNKYLFIRPFITGIPGLFVALFLFVKSSDAQVSDSVDSIIEIKKTLAVQLDSLEVEKQARKRLGEPLAELEEESQKIYDSLAILRNQLTESIPESLKTGSGDGYPGIFKDILKLTWRPASLFDWIIIFVGFIAVFSGVLLVGGVAHSLFSRSGTKSRSRKTPLSQAGKLPPLSETRPPIINTPAENEDSSLASLRKRMRQDIDHIQRFNAPAAPFSSSPNPPEIPRKQDGQQESQVSIRETILNAAGEGLSVQEISKKYHISIDQVTLVLRIAKKGS